jgi:signal peptidase II
MQAVPANRAVLFVGIAALGCLADLATKHWIFGWLGNPLGQRWRVWKNVVYFETTLNEGALFGIGQGMWLLFAVLSVAAAVAILVWLFYAGAARDLVLTVALGLVTAGILGNLYDRLGLHGLKWGTAHGTHQPGDTVHAVRDWILVYIGRWPWPTFNLADSMLVTGAVLLVWHAWRHEQAAAEPQRGKDEGSRSGENR